jgi:predicted RNase H-like HicB family nuclease
VIEKGDKNYSAFVPDLPGCIATGRSLDQLRQNMKEAIELHVCGMKEDGDPVPEPTTSVEYIEIAA